jgi:hypothetical protein
VVPRALARMTANGVVIEGFRHTLYPAGDPRTGPLLEMARQIGRRCADVRVIDAAIRYFEPRGGKPNVDVGLAALSARWVRPLGRARCCSRWGDRRAGSRTSWNTAGCGVFAEAEGAVRRGVIDDR